MIDQATVGLSGTDIDKFDFLMKLSKNEKLSRAGVIKNLIREEYIREKGPQLLHVKKSRF